MNLFQRSVKSLYDLAFRDMPPATTAGAQVFWPDWPSQSNAVVLSGRGAPFESSLVMAAVNWAGTVFAEPIVQVLKQRAPQEWEPVTNAPLTKLWELPNPYYSGATMMKAIAYYWLTAGNVYIGKRRDTNGICRELWLIDSAMVKPVTENADEFISYYEVTIRGQATKVDRGDIIHFRYGLDPQDHRLGLSPLTALYAEIFTDEAAFAYSKNSFSAGGIPPYFLWPKPNADSVYQIDQAAVKASLIAATTGANLGTPVVFSAPMDIGTVGFSPDQMALKDSHSLPEERICAVLGIPALVLGFGFDEHATYSNYETALKAAWQNFVIPTLKLFATELTTHLLPEWPNTRGQWVQFDTSEIWALQVDEAGVAKREVMKFTAGLVTRNEARAAMGMQALKEPGGEEFLVTPAQAAPSTLTDTKALTVDQNDELRSWFKRHAPGEAAGMLDAEVEKG